MIIGIAGLSVWMNFIPPKPLSDLGKKIEAARNENFPVKGVADIGLIKNIFIVKTGGNGLQTLFLGDSNCQMYQARIASLIRGNTVTERGAIFIANGGTPPLPEVEGNHHHAYHLIEVMKKTLAENPRIDRVVIVARWGMYFDPGQDYFLEGSRISNPFVRGLVINKFGKMILDLTTSGKKVIAVF
jgi:hypothetical protein